MLYTKKYEVSLITDDYANPPVRVRPLCDSVGDYRHSNGRRKIKIKIRKRPYHHHNNIILYYSPTTKTHRTTRRLKDSTAINEIPDKSS